MSEGRRSWTAKEPSLIRWAFEQRLEGGEGMRPVVTERAPQPGKSQEKDPGSGACLMC